MVGLIAIAVLLLVMNWFFHKVYWMTTSMVPAPQAADRRVGQRRARGLLVGAGPRVRRARPDERLPRGFETVLFLQSLELATDAATVIEGALLDLALTGAVAVVTFKLQRKLPTSGC